MKLKFFLAPTLFLKQTFLFFLARGIYRRNTIWDKLVFKKVQEDLGGNLRLMLVGSAPLAGNVLTFLRCALGCLVSDFQVYPTWVLRFDSQRRVSVVLWDDW